MYFFSHAIVLFFLFLNLNRSLSLHESEGKLRLLLNITTTMSYFQNYLNRERLKFACMHIIRNKRCLFTGLGYQSPRPLLGRPGDWSRCFDPWKSGKFITLKKYPQRYWFYMELGGHFNRNRDCMYLIPLGFQSEILTTEQPLSYIHIQSTAKLFVNLR